VNGLEETTASYHLTESTHSYKDWLKPITKFHGLCSRTNEQAKMVARLSDNCDLIEINLETKRMRVLRKIHALRLIRCHFLDEKTGANVVAFRLEKPLIEARISELIVMITFMNVPQASLHSLDGPDANTQQFEESLEFKVCI